MELVHLKQTFIEINNYPEQVVQKIITQVANEEIERNHNEDVADEVNDDVNLQITLPYAGMKTESKAKEMRKYIEKAKTKTKVRIAFKSRSLEPILPLKIVLINITNTTLYTKFTVQHVMFVTLVKVEEDCKSTWGEIKIPTCSNIY